MTLLQQLTSILTSYIIVKASESMLGIRELSIQFVLWAVFAGAVYVVSGYIMKKTYSNQLGITSHKIKDLEDTEPFEKGATICISQIRGGIF